VEKLFWAQLAVRDLNSEFIAIFNRNE